MRAKSSQDITLASSRPASRSGMITGAAGAVGADILQTELTAKTRTLLGIALMDGKRANAITTAVPRDWLAPELDAIAAHLYAKTWGDYDAPQTSIMAADDVLGLLAMELVEQAPHLLDAHDAAAAHCIAQIERIHNAREIRRAIADTAAGMDGCGPDGIRAYAAALQDVLRRAQDDAPSGDWMTTGQTAAEIAAADLPPIKWIVPGLLPAGLSILAAKRKRGKSFLSLQLGMDIAGVVGMTLGKYPVEGNERVLYLALEDNARRMKDRMAKQGGTPPDRLHIFHDWPRIGRGCMERLQAWMKARPDTVLVIVDVLQKVRPPTGKGVDPYQADYDAMGELHRFARDHHIAVIVVHHCRKADGEDVFDSVSGTGGITGCADTVMVLQRPAMSQDGTLWVTGRDTEEQEIAVQFSGDTCRWTAQGDAGAVRMSESRMRVLELLRDEGTMTAAAVAKALDVEYDTAKKTLQRMVDALQIRRAGGGYSI